MNFDKFVRMFEAYEEYQKMNAQPAAEAPVQPAVQAPVQLAAQAPVQPAAQAPVQPAAQAPVQIAAQAPVVSDMEERLKQLEARLMSPTIPTVEPKGLEDVFNKFLG